jgi:hypothetical protein
MHTAASKINKKTQPGFCHVSIGHAMSLKWNFSLLPLGDQKFTPHLRILTIIQDII